MKNKQVIAIFILIFFVSGCASLLTKSRKGPEVVTPAKLRKAQKGPKVLTPSPDKPALIESEFKIPKPTDYRIGADDLIEVNIWQHPDLTREVIVRPDGKISYLLIGDIQAAGLSVSELDEVMTKKFEAYAKELQEKEVTEAPPVRREYRIDLGDKLDISVWKVPDFSLSVIVRPDGKISYPLLGDIEVYGKTLTELDDDLTKKISKYVNDPQVSVMITAFGAVERKRITFVAEFISTFLEEKPEISILVKRFGSRKVIVLGEVNDPGIYDIVGNAKILDAIGYAGDFTKFAVTDNVFVIRGDITTNPEVIKVNAWSVIRQGRMSHNIPLQNQDIVYVPRSFIGDVKILIETLYPSVTNLQQSVTLREALKATWKK